MPTFRVGFVDRTPWSASPSPLYSKMDLVTVDGTTYQWISVTDGSASVTDTAKWRIFAGKGAQGAQGTAGANGAQGAAGTQGSAGAQGAQGNAGSQGTTGAQGSQGSAGAQGAGFTMTHATFDDVVGTPISAVGTFTSSLNDSSASKRRVFIDLPNNTRRGLAWEGEGGGSATFQSGLTVVGPDVVAPSASYTLTFIGASAVIVGEVIASYEVQLDGTVVSSETDNNYSAVAPTVVGTVRTYVVTPIDTLGNRYAPYAKTVTVQVAGTVGPDTSNAVVMNKPSSIAEGVSFTTWIFGVKDVGGGAFTFQVTTTPANIINTFVTGDKIDFVGPASIASSTNVSILIKAMGANGVSADVVSFNTSVIKNNTDPNYSNHNFAANMYMGTGSATNVVNDVDLNGNAGMVLIKDRGVGETLIFDTLRGSRRPIKPGFTTPQETVDTTLTTFNTQGFGVGNEIRVNGNGKKYSAYTFKRQTKFFDVQLYTGDGAASRIIGHNLGCEVGAVIFKKVTGLSDWLVYHRQTAGGNGNATYFNRDDVVFAAGTRWSTNPATNSTFTVGSHSDVNASGETYIAYFFAHDDAADSSIKCLGGTGSVSPGWLPQFALTKVNLATYTWELLDELRGIPVTTVEASSKYLPTLVNKQQPEHLATASTLGVRRLGGDVSTKSTTWAIGIYIRRPRLIPTAPADVLTTVNRTSDLTAGQRYAYSTVRPDLSLVTPTALNTTFNSVTLMTTALGEFNYFLPGYSQETSTGIKVCETRPQDASYYTSVYGLSNKELSFYAAVNDLEPTFVAARNQAVLSRAVGVYDYQLTPAWASVVAPHELEAQPEFILTQDLASMATIGTNTFTSFYFPLLDPTNLYLDGASSVAKTVGTFGTSDFTTGQLTAAATAAAAVHLFASKAGISKAGSYVGNGTTQVVPCGFATGARLIFILNKTTKRMKMFVTHNGSWTSTEYFATFDSQNALGPIDTIAADTTGFVVKTGTAINDSGVNYLYFAVA